MLKLNIIPNSIKKERTIFSYYLSIKDLLYIILITVFVYAILFSVVLIILQFHFNETIFQTSGIIKKAENFNKKISNINQVINNAADIQKDFVNWIGFYEFLSNNIPDGISLYQVNISKENKSLSISGRAETREKLIQFKESLEGSDFLENIDFPIKNLLEKNDINFTIGSKFKSYEFIRE